MTWEDKKNYFQVGRLDGCNFCHNFEGWTKRRNSDGRRGSLAVVLFKKWAIPGLSFIYFRLFKQTLQFLQQINVKNAHLVYGAVIRTHNLWNESPPITTRPELPPYKVVFSFPWAFSFFVMVKRLYFADQLTML